MAQFSPTGTNKAPTGSVLISGTPIAGNTLTASNSLADADGLGPIAYQWNANGVPIDGATASTLLLTGAQVGKAISVTASYTDGGGTAESVATALVASTPTPPASPGRSGGEYRNAGAFAALKDDGSVVTWGNSSYGGNNSGVADNFRSGVRQIFSTRYAFAALKDDGSVVTWGLSSYGGDSSGEADNLRSGVSQIFSTYSAFAALKADGSVVTWGDSSNGGNSSGVDLSRSVSDIFSTYSAFAALKHDGSVATWGNSSNGGYSSGVDLRSGISQIVSTGLAFAALKANGSVVTWGNSTYGGNSSGVAGLSSRVSQIFSSFESFAALKDDGSVVTWGNSGGDSSGVDLSSGVRQILSTGYAFAALKANGSVVTWGFSGSGGDSSGVAGLISSGVRQIFSTFGAFAALKTDGSVVTWGDNLSGGNSSGVDLSSGVSQIFSNGYAFAALKDDGSVVTWGVSGSGGDSSGVADSLRSGITQIFSTEAAFAALKDDGSVVTWGESTEGGDSSGVTGLSSGVVGMANPFTDDVLLLVQQNPNAPTITSGDSTDFEENSGGIAYQATASHPGGTTSFLWSLGGVDAARFTIDSVGAVRFKASPNFEAPLDAGANNVYDITVTATDESISSDPKAVTISVTNANDKPTGSLLISGTPIVGNTLTASNSLADGDGLGPIAYQWNANGIPIAGATASTLLLTVAQLGKAISVTASYTDGDDTEESVSTALVATTPIPQASPGRTGGEYRNGGAFAALKDDGSVITWGNSSFGGDSSGVDLSSGVSQIFSNILAFAALKDDGSVVTWGNPSFGGDSSAVLSQLRSGVSQIFSTDYAFAALKADGSVVTWGEASEGGDSSAVTSQLLSGVSEIFSTHDAFAALKANGSVVTWGSFIDSVDSSQGGDSSAVASQLSSGVSTIFSSRMAFAALKANGSVVTWGDPSYGGDSSGVDFSSGVSQIFSTDLAFAALKANGSVVTWGGSSDGGDSSGVAASISSDVRQIFSTNSAFAALKANGSVVTWGFSSDGGDSSGVADSLRSGVIEIFSTALAFAALKEDGSVVTWGDPGFGGDSSGVDFSGGISQIFSTDTAFAALKLDGSVVTWGESDYGGDSSGVDLSGGVSQIFSTNTAFAALKFDGSVVTWGFSSTGEGGGGDSSSVAASLRSGVVGMVNPFTNDDLLFVQQSSVPPNNPPAVTSGATATVAENSSGIVYQATASDPDAGATLSWTLGGTDKDFFSIDSATGAVRFKVPPNFEAPQDSGAINVYAITVTSTDGSLSSDAKAVAISVTDVNEAPTAVALSNVTTSLAENTNTSSRIKVADIVISDDVLGSNTISLLGADAAFFEVDGTALYLKAGTSFNYENQNSYAVTISVLDSTIIGSSAVTTGYSLTVEGAPLPTIDAITGDDRIDASERGFGFLITGTGVAGATVGLTFSSGLVLVGGATALVDGLGNWSLSISSTDLDGFGEGADSISAIQTLASTGFSSAAATRPFTVQAPPLLAIDSVRADQSEGDTGSKAFTFTVTRTGDTSGTSSAAWAVTGSGSNPADPSDFSGAVLPSGIVNFAAGDTSQTITVNVNGDTGEESDEGFTVTLSSPSGATLTTSTASGTISNDDLPFITLAVSPASVTEDGTANLIYTFTRTGPSTSALTVNYGITGTADAADYTGATPGTGKTISFAAGSDTATLTINPTADTTIEVDEYVALTLDAGTGYIVGTTAAATGTISNDDPNVTLALTPGSVTEDGVANLAYTFTRTGPIIGALTVNYTVSGTATVGIDYTGISTTDTTRTVTFDAGSATAIVTLDPIADTSEEGNETVVLTLATGSGYTVGNTATAIGTILDSDAVRTSLVNGLGGSAGFGENFLGRNDDQSTGLIDLRSVFGDAGISFFGSFFADLYVNNNGGVSFRNPIASFTPTTITGNTLDPFISAFWADVDTRGSSVDATPGGTSTGSNLVWYDLDPSARTLTATWDDVGYFSAKTNRLNAFQLSLTQVGIAGDFDIIFRYEALGWTTGDASDGIDGLGGSVARAGYTSGNGVNFFELPQSGNETGMLDLTGASNIGIPGTFIYNVRSGAVQLVTLDVSSSAVAEDGSANLVFTFTRTGSTSSPLTVNYAVAGTATLGVDYSGISASSTIKTVTFATGSATATVIVDPNIDREIELDETVSLTLADGAEYNIGTSTEVTAIIQNDDLVGLNQPPTSVALNNVTASLAENTNTSSRIKLADIAISDDALGSNSISLLGADAAFFEVDGTALYLKAGISLNYENQNSYAVTVSVVDSTIIDSSAVSTGYSLVVTDVNEAPTAVGLNNVTATLAENTNTRSRIKVADIVISDDALGSNSIRLSGTDGTSNTISLQGDDAAAFEVIGSELYLKAFTRLDYETKASYAVTVSVSDSTISDFGAPVSTVFRLAVTDVNEAPTSSVVISGTPIKGNTLTATNNLGDADVIGPIVYQWRANGIPIIGATANSLLLTGAHVGKTISVTTFYTDRAGTKESVSTALVATMPTPQATPGRSGGEYRNAGAFAALKEDGSVITWGLSLYGGNSSGVDLSGGVNQVFSNTYAFAALKNDGSVVSWGHSSYGGNSSGVAGLSRGVIHIFSTESAFAALKEDGSVVSWGLSSYGGNSSGVDFSSGVSQIFSTAYAFAALKNDGSVVTWGDSHYGGNSRGVDFSSGVSQIFSTTYAFAALKSNGSVVSWGLSFFGGNSSGVADRLSSGVRQIFSTTYAFAALKDNGSVVTWGNGSYGGNSSGVADRLSSGVTQIFSTTYAFAALKENGSVVTWGDKAYGGNSSGVADRLSSGVSQIFSTTYAFAALKADGSVVSWGNGSNGGDSSRVAGLSSGVRQIFSTNGAFAALKADGSVITWGNNLYGGNSSGVAGLSSGVIQIFTTESAFAALKDDGSILTWGNNLYGGNSNGVAGLRSRVVAMANPFTDDDLLVVQQSSLQQNSLQRSSLPTTTFAASALSRTFAVSDAALFDINSAAIQDSFDTGVAPTQTLTIASVSDNTAPIEVVVAEGRRTHDTTPTLTGTLSAPLGEGESLRLYNGSILLVDGVVDNSARTWSATPTLTTDGTYTVTARVVDAAGSPVALSASRSFHLDTTAPSQSVAISAISANAGTITGPLANGAITNDTTPALTGTLSGALATAEVLRIYSNGAFVGHGVVSGTNWSYTLATPLSANGSTVFTAQVIDAAGNSGPLSEPRSIVLDAPISSAAKDTLIGTIGAAEIYRLPQLASSLLGPAAAPTYDTITNFEASDKLQVGGRSYNTRLTTSSGTAAGLDPSQLAAVLPAAWVANSARAFKVSGFDGTFVALNDGLAGFQGDQEAILFFSSYNPSANTPIGIL